MSLWGWDRIGPEHTYTEAPWLTQQAMDLLSHTSTGYMQRDFTWCSGYPERSSWGTNLQWVRLYTSWSTYGVRLRRTSPGGTLILNITPVGSNWMQGLSHLSWSCDFRWKVWHCWKMWWQRQRQMQGTQWDTGSQSCTCTQGQGDEEEVNQPSAGSKAVTSNAGKRYMLNLIDDFTSFSWNYTRIWCQSCIQRVESTHWNWKSKSAYFAQTAVESIPLQIFKT